MSAAIVFFLYYVGGRQAHGPPDGKRSPWPMNVCNTKGVTHALPTLQGKEESWEGVGRLGRDGKRRDTVSSGYPTYRR